MTKESDSSVQPPIEPPVITFDNSIRAAKEGKLTWAFVNASTSKIYDEFQFIEWALRSGVSNENLSVRTFAVGFIEMSVCEFNMEQVETLKTLMLKNENSNVRYLTGFVLFNHDIRSEDVMKTIKRALKDPILGEKAQECLGQLKNESRKISLFGRDAGN